MVVTTSKRFLLVKRKVNVGASGARCAHVELLEVIDPDRLEVVVELLTTDASMARLGDKAQVILQRGVAPLDASVVRISRAGFVKPSALGVEEERTEGLLGTFQIAGVERRETEIAQERHGAGLDLERLDGDAGEAPGEAFGAFLVRLHVVGGEEDDLALLLRGFVDGLDRVLGAGGRREGVGGHRCEPAQNGATRG